MNFKVSNQQTIVLIVGLVLAMLFAGEWIGENLALSVLVGLSTLAGWAALTFFSAKPVYAILVASIVGVLFYMSDTYARVAATGALVGGIIQKGLWFGGLIALAVVAFHFAKKTGLLK